MKIAIVSGYFDPINPGHLEIFSAAKNLADKLIVILNNDGQLLKKYKKVTFTQQERKSFLKKIPEIDEIVISIDKDPSVKETLRKISKKYSKEKLIFCNGGSKKSSLDLPETEVCRENDIKLEFNIGEHLDESPYDFFK